VPSDAMRVIKKPARYQTGRWIDAELTTPVIVTAYEDDKPVYAAFAVKGEPSYPTRPGDFSILRRVANERMHSDTIGIPLGSPGSWDLYNVLYTQYFTPDGASIHYNYWRANWGYAGSHGCLGMNLEDSKWFWEFATIGTPVLVHS
jgi:lipoprotein-anchoring transpeptidase ErfK/SrfK